MKSKTHKEGKAIEINVEKLDRDSKKTPNKRTSLNQVSSSKVESKSVSAKRENKE